MKPEKHSLDQEIKAFSCTLVYAELMRAYEDTRLLAEAYRKAADEILRMRDEEIAGTQRAVIAYLEVVASATLQQILLQTKASPGSVRKTLSRLVAQGKVRRIDKGEYALEGKSAARKR